MKKLQKIFTVIIFLVPCFLFSQNLVYKPINPFFGGDTFNYQQLLAAANAQNDFEEDNGFNFSQPTDLENFTESLNRQLLNSISQDLFQQQFGDQTLTVGTFVFGSLVVDVSPTSGGLLINILDTSTGEQTQITIPN
ncbi:curli assembly protein CsgF [Lutibacter profundi]|uniref:Curli production assembly/transport component CsgF n=1 Tax=Lutibacter profundi TaxID=1622118 RepID=A0A109RP60_9FLAO|nr:curli production assembly/transport component CsgF [Lutibacter profundi]AMC11947.1 curli assembly protein CsgF [Lutibacter profundi]